MTKKSRLLSAIALLLFGSTVGCIKAPDVVLLDNKTALEQQAAGEFHALENDLLQAGITAKAENITRGQLEKQHSDRGGSSWGEIVALYSAVQIDAEWIDQMLVAGCVGEALDGLLIHTPQQCSQDLESKRMARILGRQNLHRRQIWRLLLERPVGRSLEQVRQTWRSIHLQRVICGGLIQVDSTTWEKKKC